MKRTLENCLHRYRMDDYKHKTGRTIFVCSMSDLFGDFIPDD
jgi:protein gp37